MKSSRRFQKITTLIRIMKRILIPSQPIRTYHKIEFEEVGKEKRMVVPQDVKEGHFVVFAVKCEKPERFVVELKYLNNHAFLKLLEQAGEEYGFQHEGALTVPCSPEELKKIISYSR